MNNLAIVFWLAGIACAVPQSPLAPAEPSAEAKNGIAERQGKNAPSGYVLGPGDLIHIRVADLEEIGKDPIPVDTSGYVRLPVVGAVMAAGLTIERFEAELGHRLNKYLLHPDVSVSVAEARSQPVSVIGAVKSPGVYQVQGRKTVIEVLSLAGGLDPAAGSTLNITRRLEAGTIPLKNATVDPTGQFSVAQVSVKSILEARNPQENILIKPFDVISVPRAQLVYVVGDVNKAGGFVLNERETMSVLQALSLAGGLDRGASPKNSRILRAASKESARSEIPVDLKSILDGRTPDFPMQPEDILFVPNSTPKRAATRALEAAIQAGTGIVIWRR